MPAHSAWRLFVAAPMPAADAERASAAMAALRARHPAARWLPPHKLHLTLVFLGQTESRDVQRIAAVTAAVAAKHRAYDVVTGNGGGRIHTERGGVCWLRLEEGGRETSQLALDLDEALGSATYDATHPPHPHLTLARGIDRATLDAGMGRRSGCPLPLLHRSERVGLRGAGRVPAARRDRRGRLG